MCLVSDGVSSLSVSELGLSLLFPKCSLSYPLFSFSVMTPDTKLTDESERREKF